MPEDQVVQKTEALATVESLQADLEALGIEKGMVLLVHSSLSALGWVCGGAVAVIIALQEVLEETGTLVMPAHSTDLSDPSQWKNPPVPESWWQIIRDTMPAYDPNLTPTRSMGKIAETFRKQNGVLRSAHPQSSFCARGPQASSIINNHALAYGFGEHSPLARIYDLQGYVLLLGVDHSSNTSIHLAEYRADFPSKRVVQEGAPISQAGSTTWTTFEDIDVDDSDFDRLGEDFLRSDEEKIVQCGKVGIADCQLMPQRAVVDYAVNWLEKNRGK
ncbi:MAG: AAC(3) family N-acetyltransferase [Candidatus Poribacteria bacterium]|nr:AAC(3) family N-acetyltransferase [Candidatus Poribacteria bacterium]